MHLQLQPLAIVGCKNRVTSSWPERLSSEYHLVDESPAFFKYMERCQAMLQEGNFVADMLLGCRKRPEPGYETKGAKLELNDKYDYDRSATTT